MTHKVDLTALKDAADKACKAAIMGGNAHRAQTWNVNWAELTCVDVERYENCEGKAGFNVYIEEAAPDNWAFRTWIAKWLAKHKFPNCRVFTEW